MEENTYTVKQSPNGSTHWYDEDGALHCIGAPAIITLSKGLMISEEWYKHGRLHNLNGHARIGYKQNADGDMDVTWSQHWIDGEQLSEKEFTEQTTVKQMTMDEINTKLGCIVDIVE